MSAERPKVTMLLRCTWHGWDGDPENCRGCIERTGVMRFFVLWSFAALILGPIAATFWFLALGR